MAKIIPLVKPNGRKQYICCFLQYQVLKARKRINLDSTAITENSFLVSANSYCNFHILLIYYILYYPLWTFTLYFPCFPFFFVDRLSMFPFLFYWSNLKVGTMHSSDSSLFRKRSIIGQLNVPTATAERKDQYTLSNIIYIGFQNSYSFLWNFLW